MATSTVSGTGTRRLRSAARGLAGPLGALGSIATVAMMVVTTVDVLSRNLAGRSIPGLLELTETLLVVAVFLGLSYAGVANAHVSVDLLTSHFPPALSHRVAGVMWLLGAGMTAWFLVACAQRASASVRMGEISTGLVDWPLWPARWVVVIGLTAFLLVALVNGYLGLRGESLLGEDADEDFAGDASGTAMEPHA